MAVDELDLGTLGPYLEANVEGFVRLTGAEKFADGQSNPTFLLTADSGQYVLRRQPPGELLKSAHAVDREYRVIRALADTDVPVAQAHHLCEDRDLIGSMYELLGIDPDGPLANTRGLTVKVMPSAEDGAQTGGRLTEIT